MGTRVKHHGRLNGRIITLMAVSEQSQDEILETVEATWVESPVASPIDVIMSGSGDWWDPYLVD